MSLRIEVSTAFSKKLTFCYAMCNSCFGKMSTNSEQRRCRTYRIEYRHELNGLKSIMIGHVAGSLTSRHPNDYEQDAPENFWDKLSKISLNFNFSAGKYKE